jgi:hypothetical protein
MDKDPKYTKYKTTVKYQSNIGDDDESPFSVLGFLLAIELFKLCPKKNKTKP